LEKTIKKEFPECEVFIGGNFDFGVAIMTRLPGHDGVYSIRHEFTAAQLDLAKDQEGLLRYVAHKIVTELKERRFT
jgi:hypothetical protein